MQRTYTVEGKWPFPTDMLRHDCAQPGTPDSKRLIERLSGPHTDNGFGFHEPVRIELVMEAGDALPSRPSGRYRPNYRRWESFGWKVVAGDPEIEADLRFEATAASEEALRKSALAKLTPDERRALGV